MGKVDSGVLAYRQMLDGVASFERAAEYLCIEVIAPPVEADVDVLQVATEREDSGAVVPDGAERNTANCIGEGGVVCEGDEGAAGLERRAEVEGMVEKWRSDAKELSGDEEGCDAFSGQEEICSGAGGSEREGEYTDEEFFGEGCERAEHSQTGARWGYNSVYIQKLEKFRGGRGGRRTNSQSSRIVT